MCLVLLLTANYQQSGIVNGQNIEEIKKKIDEKNKTIIQLENEINIYKTEVEVVGKEKQTLQKAVKTLDITEQKLNTDIKLAENKIGAANYTIEKLNIEINKAEQSADRSLSALADIIRGVNESDNSSLIEILLTNENISDFWNDLEVMETLQKNIKTKMAELRVLKEELAKRRDEQDEKKNELVELKGDLGDKKKLVSISKKEKDTLLSTTQSKEANYRRILNEKIALKNAFEKELLEFESQLKLAIDPQSYAKAGQGVLSWPLDNIKITQYFGDTAFAKAGAYNGKGHNGVDFGTPTGTVVKSAASGFVVGTGDTDLVCPGASYGKWILVEHPNGLSTLYAHLSLIKATKGQKLLLGETIGFSGNTGYSTGPHLHFTVYATQGVRVLEKKSAVCGGTYIMPIADLKAYLNPMSYL